MSLDRQGVGLRCSKHVQLYICLSGGAVREPGILVLRIEGPLFYANVGWLRIQEVLHQNTLMMLMPTVALWQKTLVEHENCGFQLPAWVVRSTR